MGYVPGEGAKAKRLVLFEPAVNIVGKSKKASLLLLENEQLGGARLGWEKDGARDGTHGAQFREGFSLAQMQGWRLSMRASLDFVLWAPCLPRPNPGSAHHAGLPGSHLGSAVYVT